MNEMQSRHQKDDLDMHYEDMDDLGREELVRFARFLVSQSPRRQSSAQAATAKVIALPVRFVSRKGN